VASGVVCKNGRARAERRCLESCSKYFLRDINEEALAKLIGTGEFSEQDTVFKQANEDDNYNHMV